MPRTPLVFGKGLDRESGVQATRRSSMEDSRNLLLYEGKALVRRGIGEILTFAGATHILAIQPIRADRTGVIVVYDDTTGAVDVWGIDAEATTSTFIGLWFTKATDITEPPIVSTTEVDLKVFLAHANPSVTGRATTFVYDRRASPTLYALTADLDDDTVFEDVKFRGVERYKEYLFGWGYGDETDQERPEIVRVSLPGLPKEFKSEGYLLVGDRKDPVITCKPAGGTFLVFKETETHQIVGYDRATFGTFPIDGEFGCVGDRLAISVAGLCFFWSAQGPRISDGRGESGDATLPLDYFGYDPASLIAHGAEDTAFATYLPVQRVVQFVFGRRVYAYTVRSGLANAKWSYWELGFTPFSAGTLFAGDTGIFPTPTGFPTCLSLDGSNGSSLDYVWTNNSQDGDEFNEVWVQAIANLVADWEMDTGSPVVDNFTGTTGANHTTTFSLNSAAQKIAVTAATAADFSGVDQGVPATPTIPVTAGVTYMLEVVAKAASLVAGARGTLTIKWYDNVPNLISTETRVTFTNTVFELKKLEATAPVGAVAAEIHFELESQAAGDTGEVWFKLARFFDSSATWSLDQVVNVTNAATQPATISMTNPGSGYRVRSRYGRGFEFTAGYTSGDPDDWPDTSECYALAQSAGVTEFFVAWWQSNSPAQSSHLIWAVADATWAAMLAAGASAGFRIDRDDDGGGYVEEYDLLADGSNPPISGTLYVTDWKDVMHFGYDENYAGETLQNITTKLLGISAPFSKGGLTWFALDDVVHGFSEIDVAYRVTPYIGATDMSDATRTRYMGPEHEPERAALGDGPVTTGGGAGSQPAGGGPINYTVTPGPAGTFNIDITHASWFWDWVQDCYCALDGFCDIDTIDHYRKKQRAIVAAFLVEWRQPNGAGAYTADSAGWQECVGGGPGPGKFIVSSKNVTGLATGNAGVRVKYRVSWQGGTVEGPPGAEKVVAVA